MQFLPKLALSAAVLVGLSGCFSREVRDEIDAHEDEVRRAIEQPAVTTQRGTVQATDRLYIPVRKVVAGPNRSGWLMGTKPLSVDLETPVPLTAVMRMISEQGVNVVSDLPLDGYTWAGKINSTDTETALRMVLGGVGLDYDIDEERRLVTVRPVRSKTWTLNLGDRKTTFSSGGTNSQSLTDSDTNVTQASNGGMGSNYNTATQNTAAAGGGEGTKITAEDNFWKSIGEELTARLAVRLPSQQGGYGTAAAGAPAADGKGAGAQTGLTTIGTFAVNKETGAITVSAPHWILSDLDKYFAKVQAMYNAEITFTGELLMVSRNRSDSEGLDISAFGDFASGRYNAIVQNNALGGVTLSFPSGPNNLANATAAAQTVPGALIGVASPADALQVFNAWLSEVGRVKVVQRPVITTTSGVPAEFKKQSTTYFNLVSQETATGGVSGAVSATRNTLQSKTFGMQLSINPRYDFNTGLVRAQITLNHVLPAGELVVNQTINVGDDFETIPTRIPLDTKMAYSGEALLRDGDLVIVGGQNEENSTLTENGLPAKRGALSGIFGTKAVSRDNATYYFALRVAVKAR